MYARRMDVQSRVDKPALLTGRNLLIRIKLLKQTLRIIDHICPLCQLILGSLNLFRWKLARFGKPSKERKSEMTIEVRDNGRGEIVFCHD